MSASIVSVTLFWLLGLSLAPGRTQQRLTVTRRQRSRLDATCRHNLHTWESLRIKGDTEIRDEEDDTLDTPVILCPHLHRTGTAPSLSTRNRKTRCKISTGMIEPQPKSVVTAPLSIDVPTRHLFRTQTVSSRSWLLEMRSSMSLSVW